MEEYLGASGHTAALSQQKEQLQWLAQLDGVVPISNRLALVEVGRWRNTAS